MTEPGEDLHLDAFRITMLVDRKKAKEIAREAEKDGRFHVHRDVTTIIPKEGDGMDKVPVAGPGEEWISVCTGIPRPVETNGG